MSDNPLIIWEKWRDPYGHDDILDIEETLENNDDIGEFLDDNQNISIPSQSNTQENHTFPQQQFKQKIPFMFTPMGIIPYTENTAASYIFNFWTGHTNFNLSKKICNIIEETDGIETLDIFTRYRFRIGVGKCFIDSSVMRKINKNIYQYFLM